MATIFLALLGIFLMIANANAWIIVPVYVIWICFAFAVLILVAQVIHTAIVERNIRKIKHDYDVGGGFSLF